MSKMIGITVFLLLLYLALFGSLFYNPDADLGRIHYFMGERLGMYGILSMAVGMLILTGGIDLSIGSQVALYAVVFGQLTVSMQVPASVGLVTILLLGMLVGLGHGLLVTKLRLQPFMVTLCGMFIYRSLAQYLTGGLRVENIGSVIDDFSRVLNTQSFFGVSYYLVILVGLAAVAAVFLHGSAYGRYFYAVGSNEQAARYAGIPTDWYRILAYIQCSAFTALFTFLTLAKTRSAEPSTIGINEELRAIGSAVLGGCALRGGEGNIYGMLVGSLIIVIIRQFTTLISDTLEGTLIGCVLVIGITIDELLRRRRRLQS